MGATIARWTYGLVSFVLVIATGGCLPLRGLDSGSPSRTIRPPRPVEGSTAWRGRRPGYSIYTGFVPTSPRRPSRRDPRCRIQVRHVREAPADLEVLGLVSVEKIGPAIVRLRGGEDQALGWLRAKACRVGATVMFDVRTGTEWFVFRDRLVRAIRGTARVALLRPAPPRAEPRPPATVEDEATPNPQPGGTDRPSPQPPSTDRPFPIWID